MVKFVETDEVVVTRRIILLSVELPAEYEPEGSNEVADSEYHHYHANHSEEIA